MSLDFETIKRDCVSGETIIIGDYGLYHTFIGWSKSGSLVTQTGPCEFDYYEESDIKNWTIKKEPTEKKLYAYSSTPEFIIFSENSNIESRERRPEFDLTFKDGE